MPPVRTATESVPATLPIAEPYQRPAITPRGTAYLRLSEFADVWAELSPEDRAWFSEDLRDLLVEAVVPGVEPAPTA